MASRGVLTMAFGPARYIEMAKTLGRSLQLHSPDTPRAVVTDSSDRELAHLFTSVVPLRPERGSGVAQKLALYEYSPRSVSSAERSELDDGSWTSGRCARFSA